MSENQEQAFLNIETKGTGQMQITLPDEFKEQAQKIVDMRETAKKLEQALLQEIRKHPIFKALEYLGHPVCESSAFMMKQSKYQQSIARLFNGNYELVVTPTESKSQVYVPPMDPKTLNLLLSGKLLSESEKRELLSKEFGDKVAKILADGSQRNAEAGENARHEVRMLRIIDDLLQYAVYDYEKSDECVDAVQRAKELVAEHSEMPF